MVANERAARELGKAEPADPAGLVKSLPPKVSTIVDTDRRRLNHPVSLVPATPPLRPAVFAKTTVFPLIQAQISDFRQRQESL